MTYLVPKHLQEGLVLAELKKHKRPVPSAVIRAALSHKILSGRVGFVLYSLHKRGIIKAHEQSFMGGREKSYELIIPHRV